MLPDLLLLAVFACLNLLLQGILNLCRVYLDVTDQFLQFFKLSYPPLKFPLQVCRRQMVLAPLQPCFKLLKLLLVPHISSLQLCNLLIEIVQLSRAEVPTVGEPLVLQSLLELYQSPSNIIIGLLEVLILLELLSRSHCNLIEQIFVSSRVPIIELSYFSDLCNAGLEITKTRLFGLKSLLKLPYLSIDVQATKLS